MGEFLDAALGFPAVVFSAMLVVVVLYWLLVLVGAFDVGEADGDGGVDGLLDRLDLGGTPATVVLSVVVAIAWFLSLVGTVLLDAVGMTATARVVLAVLVLLAALVLGGLAARFVVRPLRRLFPTGPEASRTGFVGRECVIRTGRVDTDFGQAEVHAADGSSAVIQVRQTGADSFTAGSRAYIYDYDSAGEFFWVVPADLSDRPKDR